MMMTPPGMAIAAMTVMLWIMWSDTIRAKRPQPILYALRIALFLVVSGILTLNLFRYPNIYSTGTRVLTVVTVAVGVAGAVYFGRKLVKRT
ncbi:MAG TPA: hypothetical protein VF618_11040 [Thermoanaerobaculia bacterium]